MTTMPPTLPRLPRAAAINLLGLLLMLAGSIGLTVALWHLNGWAGAATLAAYGIAVGGYLAFADLGES